MRLSKLVKRSMAGGLVSLDKVFDDLAATRLR